MSPDTFLSTYLNDHLGGSTAAIALLERFAVRYADSELEVFFRDLLREVQADQRTLRELCERFGPISRTRRAAGWLAAQVSRLKLEALTGPRAAFALFEGLEMLGLGILGKRNLWRTLQVVARADSRFDGWDFVALEARAEEQADRVERLRRATALSALRPQPRTRRNAPIATHTQH